MKKLLPYIIIFLLIMLLVIIGISSDDETPIEPHTLSEDAIEMNQDVSQSIEPTTDIVKGVVESRREFWRKAYQTPMDFYGLILDENDHPIPSASVRISWNDSESENNVVQKLSDEDGRFAFLGRRGLSLRVRVEKEGYYQIFTAGGSKQNLDFFASKGKPDNDGDPNNPAIFRLKKKGEGVDLITSEFRNKLPQSGEAKIDLLTGKLSPNGQLELSMERLSEEWHFPWTAKATIKGGGFAKAEGQFMHEAPEAVYVEELNWSFPLDDEGRQKSFIIKEDYYVKFGSPAKYGRIMIYLKSHSRHLLLESWVNPDGGRNLEPKH